MFASLRLWGAVAALVVVVGTNAWLMTKAYQAGRSAEQAAFLDRINQENEDAGSSAEDWRGQYRRCVDAGRLFDFETGACHD